MPALSGPPTNNPGSPTAGGQNYAKRRKKASASRLSVLLPAYHHGQFADTADEAGTQVDGITHHFNVFEAVHDLFPEDPQLHFPKPIAEAAVDAIAKGHVASGIGT